jgi:hypothetical protein
MFLNNSKRYFVKIKQQKNFLGQAFLFFFKIKTSCPNALLNLKVDFGAKTRE